MDGVVVTHSNRNNAATSPSRGSNGCRFQYEKMNTNHLMVYIMLRSVRIASGNHRSMGGTARPATEDRGSFLSIAQWVGGVGWRYLRMITQSKPVGKPLVKDERGPMSIPFNGQDPFSTLAPQLQVPFPCWICET